MFKSTHNLDFEVAEWEYNILKDDADWCRFRIGTCEGVWCSRDSSYDILSIHNNDKGNGHLKDVFEWFEQSCIRDGKDFRILEVWNIMFKQHLLNKQGFITQGRDNVIKKFVNEK